MLKQECMDVLDLAIEFSKDQPYEKATIPILEVIQIKYRTLDYTIPTFLMPILPKIYTYIITNTTTQLH